VTVLNRRNRRCHFIVTVTVTKEMAYLCGVPACVTVVTLVTVICGGFLGAGVRLPFVGS
jgi:hypothetical protein